MDTDLFRNGLSKELKRTCLTYQSIRPQHFDRTFQRQEKSNKANIKINIADH